MARGKRPRGEGTSKRLDVAADRERTRPSPIHNKKADAILCADIHLMSRTPKCRTDDFITAMLRKLSDIALLQQENGNCPVLCAGDVFDEWFLHKGEQWLMTEAIRRIHNWIVVPGQHDLPQHNLELYGKSNLAVLEEAGNIVTIGTDLGDIDIWGFPWGKEPEARPKRQEGDVPRVALVHRMTYQGKPPYPGAEKEGGTAKTLMRRMGGFDLIVTGDNHESFVIQTSDQLLINPGSMMRTTAKQANHEPCVFLWWANSNRIEKVVLDHEKGVVSWDHIDQKQERDDRIAAWVERIGKGDVELELGYRENVERYMKRNDIPKAIADIVREVVE